MHVDLDGKPDCAATLSSNSDFNANDTHWNAGANAAVRWVPLDVEGVAHSGSMAVKNIEMGDFDGLSAAPASQCISAAAGQTYDYEAWAFIKSGQPYGTAQLAVWFYDQPDCAEFVNGAYALSGVDQTDHWALLKGGLVVPATSHSMSVRLVSQKPFRNAPLEILFDAVRVHTPK
jgi:hypothetical protein